MSLFFLWQQFMTQNPTPEDESVSGRVDKRQRIHHFRLGGCASLIHPTQDALVASKRAPLGAPLSWAALLPEGHFVPDRIQAPTSCRLKALHLPCPISDLPARIKGGES